MRAALFAADFPWDKLLGPFVSLIALAIVGYVRKGAKALDRMRENIDAVPGLIEKVEEATTKVADVSRQFTDFAHESADDRQSLHRRVHTLANNQATTELLVQSYVEASQALARIADRLDASLPVRRESDSPSTNFTERRLPPSDDAP